MTIQSIKKAMSVRDSASAAEWQARVELAAAYRLMDYLGLVDQAHNQICVRCAGEPDAFLMKSPAAFFDEVTASRIEKYDFTGEPRQEGLDKLHGAGHFHAAIFAARPDIGATIHSHSPANVGVSAQKHGLLPIGQHGLRFMGRIAYHDYNGLEADPTLIPLIVRDLADKKVALLRNHGALICGRSLGEAFVAHWNFEMACRDQVAALSAGREQVVLISQAAQDYTLGQWARGEAERSDGGKDWRGWLRMADRRFADLRD